MLSANVEWKVSKTLERGWKHVCVARALVVVAARAVDIDERGTYESPHRLSYLVFAVFASKIFPKFSNFSRFFGCMTSHHSRIGSRLGFSLETASRSFFILVFTVYLYTVYLSSSPDPPLTFFFFSQTNTKVLEGGGDEEKKTRLYFRRRRIDFPRDAERKRDDERTN